MSKTKIPKAVALMVEKNNLVMAIKTLAEDEGISMEAAKARIDDYEMTVKAKQQQKLTSIASKQGIPPGAISFTNDPEPKSPSHNKDKAKPSSDFASLNSGLDNRLDDLGYKKPMLPYWTKRVAIILLVMAIVFWGLWQIFS